LIGLSSWTSFWIVSRKITKIPGPNPEKSHFLPLDNRGLLLAFWVSERDAGREFIRKGSKPARKGDVHFDANPDSGLQSAI
jgi:hypothetical protein